MGNIMVFAILTNCFIVSVLLWFITFLGSYLYTTKQDLSREVHFECGFFSMNKMIPAYNLNFVISAIFLILYDIELVLLIPYFFNLYALNGDAQIGFLIFFASIIFSLLIDVETNTIKWYLN